MNVILFMANVLKVEDLITSYKGFSVKDVSFTLKSGDIFGLIGSSGSGKSTVMNSILGVKKFDIGKVSFLVDGEEASLKENVGYSSQGNALFPYLTLEENIMTFGRIYGLKKRVIKQRISLLLKLMGLENAGNKRIIELSGGMAKRADLIVALIHDPKVLILDEPFAGLDIALVNFLWKTIKYLAEQGRIIIISSHSLYDIKKNCTKIGFIVDGSYYSYEEMMKKTGRTRNDPLESLFLKMGVG